MKYIQTIILFYIMVCYGIYISLNDLDTLEERWEMIKKTPEIITLQFLKTEEPVKEDPNTTTIYYTTQK